MKNRRILEILILILTVLLGIMVTKLINVSIEAYRAASIPPTPTPTPFVFAKRTPTPTVTPSPTPGPIVMIDPGHGGIDIGSDAGGQADVVEKVLTLSIAMKTRAKLEELGFTVIMTREEDVYKDLDSRLIMSNNSEASCFVSIHLNAVNDTTSSGCEIFYDKRQNENSAFLAECILGGVCDATGARKRNIRAIENNELEVLLTKKSAVLLECGFMTSETEYPKLKDDAYQELIAQGIADGLVKYYNKLNGVN